ncbi:MAG: acyl-CoA dehydrogenase family protein [Chloroflexi bacterium]|nr:acyl-CoA dehydrogenase family protein [Chloroflexota bacterium]MBV9899392.1 acyl-CoA dehydrogenase family protein [Chloroflexota bacterium]
MDFAFELSEDQRALRQTLREFAEAEIAPHAAEWDRTGTFPAQTVRKLGELGVMGLAFPEQYGGLGAGALSFAVALEELARVDSSVAITVAASVSLGGVPILQFGSEAQKQKWLVPLARGETIGAFASTEPGMGSDVQGLSTTAREDGAGWVINGTKAYITNAGTELSSFVTTTAITGERSPGRPEVSTLIVPVDAPGFEPQKPYAKMGWHASDTRELVYADCRVPAEAMLRERGAGARIFLATLDVGRIGVAAMGVGLAQGCLDHSVAWANQRCAFGQPIAKYQAVSFELAELKARIDAARGMVFRAAALKDAGKPVTEAAAAAKLMASELAVHAANVAMQVHGGYGYMEESAIPRFYRDAKILTIGEGTSEILKLVIARQMGLSV